MPLIRSFEEKDGVLVFDSEVDKNLSTYEASHLETLSEIEEIHFWFQRRRDKICKAVERYVPKSSRILEIGGGTGFIASKLKHLGFEIEMADVHSNGFDYAKQKGIDKLYQFDLFNPPFEKEFDVICLFDVLEHLHDSLRALECLKKMLRPHGMLLMTVPAHPWLWSRDDVIAGHACRYTKRAMKELFEQSNLKLVHARYFFSAILPLLVLRKWMRRDDGSLLKQGEIFEPKMPPALNSALSALTKTEFCLDRFLPNFTGGSLLAVATTSGKTQRFSL